MCRPGLRRLPTSCLPARAGRLLLGRRPGGLQRPPAAATPPSGPSPAAGPSPPAPWECDAGAGLRQAPLSAQDRHDHIIKEARFVKRMMGGIFFVNAVFCFCMGRPQEAILSAMALGLVLVIFP